MSRNLLLILMLTLPLVLWGCPTDPDDDDDATGDDDTGDDDTGDDDTGGTDEDGDGYTLEEGDCDDTDADVNPGAVEMPDDGVDSDCDGEENPAEPYLTGTLYDVTCGEPLQAVRVTFCQVACTFRDTDAHGRFVFAGLDEAEGLFDVVGHVNPDAAYYTGLAYTFDIPAAGGLVAPDVCLPEIESVQPVESGSNEVDLGDGLKLTLDGDEIEWLLGTPEIGAVEVPDTAWQYVDLEGVDVLGVWALYAFGNMLTEDGTPIAVTLPARGDLDTGDPATVYAMSHGDGGFVEAATATTTGGDLQVVTDPGEGLHELTWIAYGVPL